MRVGYVGLGIMGRGMAANLLAKGHELTVYNRTPERCDPLRAKGARVADSPGAAASGAEVVGMCVTDGAAVDAVIRGAGGLLSALRPGQLLVDHSTISPAQTRALAEAVAETGAEFLDAPVTGGDRGAAAGTLTIMVGGSEGAFARLRPYLSAMGRVIVHVGETGQGQVVKLVNNFIGGIALAGAAEGLLIGLRAGVSLAKMMEVCTAGSANSTSLQLLADRLSRADFQPGFSLANRLKDMDLAVDAARALQAAVPVGAAVAELFRERMRDGEADMDQTVLARRYLGVTAEPVK